MDTTTYVTVSRPPIVTAQVISADYTELVVGLPGSMQAVVFNLADPEAGEALALAIANAVHDARKLRVALDVMSEQGYADELLDDLDDRRQAELDEIEAF
jgi:hypothetical protein